MRGNALDRCPCDLNGTRRWSLPQSRSNKFHLILDPNIPFTHHQGLQKRRKKVTLRALETVVYGYFEAAAWCYNKQKKVAGVYLFVTYEVRLEATWFPVLQNPRLQGD
jgi:hypothetical protein